MWEVEIKFFVFKKQWKEKSSLINYSKRKWIASRCMYCILCTCNLKVGCRHINHIKKKIWKEERTKTQETQVNLGNLCENKKILSFVLSQTAQDSSL